MREQSQHDSMLKAFINNNYLHILLIKNSLGKHRFGIVSELIKDFF